MVEYLLAQYTEQTIPARFAAQVAIADTYAVGVLFDTDEAQNPCLSLAPHDEPAIKRPVIKRITTAVAPYRGAGEKTSHLGEERGFVIIRAHLRKLAVFRPDHDAGSSSGTRVSISRRAKPKDSERAISCLSRDIATRRQDGCALRFSSAGMPASGHAVSG